MSETPHGDFRRLKARELTVIDVIQRRPSPDRIRQMKAKWDPKKIGVLLVARITDGEYKGKLHVYDGGTRWAVAMEIDPDMLLDCVITDMTLEEAAQAFLDFNQLSMKPNAFSRFKVGIRARDPVALAIRDALQTLDLEADEGHARYGNGEPGVFVALAAAERIIKAGHTASLAAQNGDEERDPYADASGHLVWVLTQTRLAYPQHGSDGPADAHDGDIVQAMSHLGITYPVIVGEERLEHQVRTATTTWFGSDSKLHDHGGLMRPSHWRVELAAGKGATTAGSSSRGGQIGDLIARNYNREFKPHLRRTATRKKTRSRS